VKRNILYVTFFFFTKALVFGQEIHFSQFYAAPFTLNPSLAGSGYEKYKIGANYRNQWATVAAPFTTYATWVEYGLKINKSDKIGLGGTMVLDKSGSGALNYFKLEIGGNYQKALDEKYKHFISVGFLGGINQRGANLSNIVFPDQNDGQRLDNTLPTSQPIANILNAAFSSGITYTFNTLGKIKLFLGDNKRTSHGFISQTGLALYHLNRPNISFTGNAKANLPFQWIFHTEQKMIMNTEVTITSRLLFMKQSSATQLNLGVEYEYIFPSKDNKTYGYYFGPYYRWGDAIILVTGLVYDAWRIGFSYDANISKLVPASYTVGSFEISIIYTEFSSTLSNISCPKFGKTR